MAKAKLTISRPQRGDGESNIEIRVKCDNSKTRFLTLTVGLADFSEILTGMSEVECGMETNSLELVGKIRESRTIEFKMPEHDHSNRKEIAFIEAQKTDDDGWQAQNYFNSQNSFTYRGDETWARTISFRWIEEGDLSWKDDFERYDDGEWF